MELIITSPGPEGFIKAIEWNHEEIKKEMQAKVATYKSIVYDDDQIKEAKADRAELNKMIKALEDKRKEIKKQCLEPYESFEKQMKELVAIIQEPVELIDRQVNKYESELKVKKLQKIRHHYEGLNFSGIEFYQIENPKWLNATVTLKSVFEELDKKAEEIKADMAIISALPEYVFEATETYKKTVDLKVALQTANSLKEAAERKAQWEAECKAKEEAAKLAQEEAQKQQAEEIPAQVEETPTAPQNEATEVKETAEDFLPNFDEIPDNRHWVTFKAFITPDQAEEIAKYLSDIGASFERI